MKTTIQALLAAAMLMTIGAPTFADTKAGFNVDMPTVAAERRRKRIPGGSGCDSPRDIREHPECTPS